MSGISLDAIQARADAATEEQVAYTHFAYHSSAHQAARQSAADVPVLVAALRAVLAAHIEATCCQGAQAHCADCDQAWPCTTVRAVTAHIDTTPKEN